VNDLYMRHKSPIPQLNKKNFLFNVDDLDMRNSFNFARHKFSFSRDHFFNMRFKCGELFANRLNNFLLGRPLQFRRVCKPIDSFFKHINYQRKGEAEPPKLLVTDLDLYSAFTSQLISIALERSLGSQDLCF